ncbi:unnamed protein product [Fraxinus pennsylvanica]|uniref:Serine-tRNA synthetase type1 N-terminal domain-containing protein n=1 Tax=Fraxinus pennsylvanica TaxID=56036 RepID=A0AAD1ZH55_9LAMI|nr:unnamed protein product [Fraxinus pennsylvanica]
MLKETLENFCVVEVNPGCCWACSASAIGGIEVTDCGIFSSSSLIYNIKRRMLDINLIREEKGGNPEKVRESQRRRFADPGLIDEVIKLDKEWRQRQFELEGLRKDFNKINKEVARLRILVDNNKCEAPTLRLSWMSTCALTLKATKTFKKTLKESEACTLSRGTSGNAKE